MNNAAETPPQPTAGERPESAPADAAAPQTVPTTGESAREAPTGGDERSIARAAAVTTALTVAGALLGLVRDQVIAHHFGANGGTDAFLVSWTVPETAATLLIEGAMALVLVPAFSLALSRRAARPPGGRGHDPVRALMASSFPRLLLALVCSTALLGAGAPVLVRLLAPGLADPALAVDCTRLTAVTVIGFGIAGYCSAALRAHRRFVPPAAIYVAYNLGILAALLALHALWGVRAAAAGVAVGSAMMVLVQLPSFLRHVAARGRRQDRRARGARRTRTARRFLPARTRTAPAALADRPAGTRPWRRTGGDGTVSVAVLAPVALFALSRQSQVLVERFLASSLPAGAISHLNYAQKVAQVPMVLSMMVCTVTFPALARSMADGEVERARRRVERDLTLAGLVVLLGAAYVVAYAPQIVELLFQRGAFDARDTAVTALVMRVYATGLLGHSLVGVLVRPFFSAARPTWYPAVVMSASLLITIAAGAAAVGPWGVYGIAAANAAGICTTALLLLHGLSTRMIPIDVRRVTTGLGQLSLAAGSAAAVGALLAPLAPSAFTAALTGCLVVPTVFAATALAVRAPEVSLLVSTVKGKFRDAR